MNPARSFASAAPSGMWMHLWVYFTAPFLGMALAAAARTLVVGRTGLPCAKLEHPADQRCIHCGYEPAPVVRVETGPRYPAPAVTRTGSRT